MPRKKEVKITEELLKMIEGLAVVRLPHDLMANVLGFEKTKFERLVKQNDAVQGAINKGKSRASTKARQTLFRLATERRECKEYYTDEDGKQKVKTWWEEPDVNALKFWCQTQENFKVASTLEISGPEGAPIEFSNKTDAELEEELIKIKKISARDKA